MSISAFMSDGFIVVGPLFLPLASVVVTLPDCFVGGLEIFIGFTLVFFLPFAIPGCGSLLGCIV